jgi:hypothetical protein
VYFRFPARAPVSLQRAPLLEHVLARADAAACVTDWRAEAFHTLAPEAAMPPIATAALRASSAKVVGTWVLVATPVHFVAGMSSVSMAADGILDLEQSEADALAADFNRAFAGAGMRLERGRECLLLCIFDTPLRVATTAPEQILGEDIWGCLPRGADEGRLRQLMSEIEMWLFEHAVNEHRRARAAPPISGLWLWGGGATDISLPAVSGWTAGNDPLFTALGAHSHHSAAEGPGAPGPDALRPDAAGPGVVVLADWPGTAAWSQAEQLWLLPALADLRGGRLTRLDLSAGDRCFSVSARGRWRFWRRPRPWWESFRMGGEFDERD